MSEPGIDALTQSRLTRHPHFGQRAPGELEFTPTYWAYRCGLAEGMVVLLEGELRRQAEAMAPRMEVEHR